MAVTPVAPPTGPASSTVQRMYIPTPSACTPN
jgi:hypothetical protein